MCYLQNGATSILGYLYVAGGTNIFDEILSPTGCHLLLPHCDPCIWNSEQLWSETTRNLPENVICNFLYSPVKFHLVPLLVNGPARLTCCCSSKKTNDIQRKNTAYNGRMKKHGDCRMAQGTIFVGLFFFLLPTICGAYPNDCNWLRKCYRKYVRLAFVVEVS